MAEPYGLLGNVAFGSLTYPADAVALVGVALMVGGILAFVVNKIGRGARAGQVPG